MTHDPAQLELLKTEIRARLEHLCTHFAPDEFDELVTEIARVKLRYADGAESGPASRGPIVRRPAPPGTGGEAGSRA